MPMGMIDRPTIDGAHPVSRALRHRLNVAARESANRPIFLSGEPGSGRRHAACVLHDLAGGGAFHAVAAHDPDVDLRIVTALGPDEGSRTLYLDRVHDLPPGVRSRLSDALRRGLPPGLRLVSSHPVSPGAMLPDPIESDDLRFRLQGVIVPVPALRDRIADVPTLAERMLHRLSAAQGRAFRTLDEDVVDLLRRHSWPGNLRELENILRSVVLMHDGEVVLPEMVAPMLPADPSARERIGSDLDRLLQGHLDEIERWVIEAVIAREGGSIPRAARALGISPSTIYRKIEAWQRRDAQAPDRARRAPGGPAASAPGPS